VTELYHPGIHLPPEQRGAIQSAVQTTLAHEQTTGTVAIHIIGKARMRQLNRDYRNTDRVTDVLSFPAREGAFANTADGFLGDILICHARAAAQAAELGHSTARELAFLAIHGALHLLGYDHMTEGDEAVMLQKQRDIMATR